jgi:hypothetical protein
VILFELGIRVVRLKGGVTVTQLPAWLPVRGAGPAAGRSLPWLQILVVSLSLPLFGVKAQGGAQVQKILATVVKVVGCYRIMLGYWNQ